MTLPPKTVTVKCPQCQQTYIAWYIPTLNPASQPSSQSGAQSLSPVCSRCGHRSSLSEPVIENITSSSPRLS